ncbi:hypothetical protein D3C86_1189460 [compost metagenome]
MAMRENQRIDMLGVDLVIGQPLDRVDRRVDHDAPAVDPEDETRGLGRGVEAVSRPDEGDPEMRRGEGGGLARQFACCRRHVQLGADGRHAGPVIIDLEGAARLAPHRHALDLGLARRIEGHERDHVLEGHLGAGAVRVLAEEGELGGEIGHRNRRTRRGQIGCQVDLGGAEDGLLEDASEQAALGGVADDDDLAALGEEVEVDGELEVGEADAPLDGEHAGGDDEDPRHPALVAHGVLDGLRHRAELDPAGRGLDERAASRQQFQTVCGPHPGGSFYPCASNIGF